MNNNTRPQRVLPLLLLVQLMLGGCMKDDSSVPEGGGIAAPEITVEGAEEGAPLSVTIEYQDVLKISPKVSAPAGTDLGYRWTLSTTDNNKNLKSEVISEEPTLDYIMSREKGGPYRLTFTVIDKSHDDLEYSLSWDVYVEGSIVSGLIIADTPDGTSTDLSYIKSGELSRDYSGETKVLRHVLSVSPKERIGGLVTSLRYSITGRINRPHINRLWAITEANNLLLFDVDNLSLSDTSEGDNLFMSKGEESPFKVYNLIVTGSYKTAYTSSGYYLLDPKQNMNQFTLPMGTDFDSSPSNNIIAGAFKSWEKDDVACWFDEKIGAFVTITKDKTNTMGYGSVDPSSAFDPNNLPHREALALEFYDAGSGSIFALLHDKQDDGYEIYEMSRANWKGKGMAQAKTLIPEQYKSILDEATSFFFAKKGAKVLYVMTHDALHAFTFGGAEGVASYSGAPVYEASQGETLRQGKLFIQGEYLADAGMLGSVNPKPAELPLNVRAVILVSEKADGGNAVRILPIDQEKLGTGALITGDEEVLYFDGFDKILDVIHIGK